MKPNADGTLTVLGQNLTTREVEALMHDLAMGRNAMEPQVAVNLLEAERDIPFQRDADITVGKEESGDVMVALRHRGFGWLVCTLSPDRARRLAAQLNRWTGIQADDEQRSRGAHLN